MSRSEIRAFLERRAVGQSRAVYVNCANWSLIIFGGYTRPRIDPLQNLTKPQEKEEKEEETDLDIGRRGGRRSRRLWRWQCGDRPAGRSSTS